MSIIQLSPKTILRPRYNQGGGAFALTSFTGSIVEGGDFTFGGNGFTTKNNGDWLSDSFDSGTVGQNLASPWTTSVSDQNEPYKYSSTNPFTGTKCAALTTNTSVSIGDWGNYILFPESWDEVFVEYALHFNITTAGSGGPQIKLGRIGSFTSFAPSQEPNFGTTRFQDNGNTAVGGQGIQILQGGDNSRGIWPDPEEWFANSSVLPNNAWVVISQYSKLSTPGVANGKRYEKIGTGSLAGNQTYSGVPGGHFASLDGSIAHTAWDGSPVMNRRSGLTDGYHNFLLPFYTRTDQVVTLTIGFVHINNSPERIVIGDASTIAACGKRVPQKTVTRGSTGGDGKYRLGDLPGSGSLWAIAFNSDGAETSLQIR